MYRFATLIDGDNEPQQVDLHDVGKNPKLAPLISHQGVMDYLRLPGVPEPEPIMADGVIALPGITIYGKAPKAIS